MVSEYWTLANKWLAVDKPEYNLIVEDWRSDEAQMTFLHCSVHIWAPSVLKMIKADVALLRERVRGPIYATGPITDDKWMRFVKLFGFEHLIDYGDDRKIFILKDNHGQLRNEYPIH